MGCAPSTILGRKVCDQLGDSQILNGKELPRLPVQIGSGIGSDPSQNHLIIFFFGGPGSQKGLLMEEMVKRFGFVTISIEDVVFKMLRENVSQKLETTADLQGLLTDDTSLLSLEEIFSTIAAQISSSSNQRFIIDIVPSLSSIQKSEAFSRPDQDKHLAVFEKTHPILCAIEMNVIDERSMLKSSEGNAKTHNKNNNADKRFLTVQRVDEADKGRLQKRLEAYHKCSSKFLSYFKRNRKFICIDISSTTTAIQAIETIHDVFLDIGFTECTLPTRAILFAYSEQQLPGVDLNSYKIRKACLSEMAQSPSQSFAESLRSARCFIEKAAPNDNFFLLLDTIGDAKEMVAKTTAFVETKLTYLDRYFQRVNASGKRHQVMVQAMTTPNGEVFLFPRSILTKMCKKIGYFYSQGGSKEVKHEEAVQHCTTAKAPQRSNSSKIFDSYL